MICTELPAFGITLCTNYNVLPIIVASLLQLFSLCSLKGRNGDFARMLATRFCAIRLPCLFLYSRTSSRATDPSTKLGFAETLSCVSANRSSCAHPADGARWRRWRWWATGEKMARGEEQELWKKGNVWDRGRKRQVRLELLGIGREKYKPKEGVWRNRRLELHSHFSWAQICAAARGSLSSPLSPGRFHHFPVQSKLAANN